MNVVDVEIGIVVSQYRRLVMVPGLVRLEMLVLVWRELLLLLLLMMMIPQHSQVPGKRRQEAH